MTDPCLSYDVLGGFLAIRERLPGTPDMAGNGGGRVPALGPAAQCLRKRQGRVQGAADVDHRRRGTADRLRADRTLSSRDGGSKGGECAGQGQSATGAALRGGPRNPGQGGSGGCDAAGADGSGIRPATAAGWDELLNALRELHVARLALIKSDRRREPHGHCGDRPDPPPGEGTAGPHREAARQDRQKPLPP